MAKIIKKNKTYSADFIKQTLDLIEANGQSISSVAKNLGLSISTVHGWVKKKRTGKLKSSQQTPEGKNYSFKFWNSCR